VTNGPMPEHHRTGLWVLAPSTVAVGEEFALSIKVLTCPYPVPPACYQTYPRLGSPFNLSPRGIAYLDNAAPRWEGALEIAGGSALRGPSAVPCAALEGTFPGDHRALGRIRGFHFTQPGTHFISVRDAATGLEASSNPIRVTAQPPELRLFWGDLHSQTFFSDGLRVPEELFHFARHEGFLDIFALADHSEFVSDRQWEYFIGVTNDAYCPGEFVTLVGQEWTNSGVGHRNLYYPGDSGPIVRSSEATKEDLERLYEVAREHRGLLIPHHSANVVMGVKWDLGHEPEHERLVEIYSIWGNSERPASEGNPRPIRVLKGEQEGRHVSDALARGYRFGFVGGGDIHDGRPGDELHVHQERPQDYHGLQRRQGIMGVFAPELTRQAIFDALWQRRCYATTNVRPYLTFAVCGTFMGGTAHAQGPRPIRVEAASEVPIARVEIVKNGREAFVRTDVGRLLEWKLEDAPGTSADHYYVRLTREDGEMAWSSPVWIEPAATGPRGHQP